MRDRFLTARHFAIAMEYAVCLGNGNDVARKNYKRALNNIPVEAKTLEAAMGLEVAMRTYLARRFNVGHEEGSAAKISVFR